MPFDPTKPADNSPILSGQLRSQFTSINGDVQTRATQANLDGAIAGTANNCNAVDFLNISISDPPTQSEAQAILDKLNEFLGATRR